METPFRCRLTAASAHIWDLQSTLPWRLEIWHVQDAGAAQVDIELFYLNLLKHVRRGKLPDKQHSVPKQRQKGNNKRPDDSTSCKTGGVCVEL